jgi:hypothetical protein
MRRHSLSIDTLSADAPDRHAMLSHYVTPPAADFASHEFAPPAFAASSPILRRGAFAMSRPIFALRRLPAALIAERFYCAAVAGYQPSPSPRHPAAAIFYFMKYISADALTILPDALADASRFTDYLRLPAQRRTPFMPVTAEFCALLFTAAFC